MLKMFDCLYIYPRTVQCMCAYLQKKFIMTLQ